MEHPSKLKKEFVTIRWFRPSDYADIAVKIGEADWTPMNSLSGDEAAEFLEGIVTKAMDEVAPVLTKKVLVNKINQWAMQGIKISTKNSYYLYRQVKHGHILKEE